MTTRAPSAIFLAPISEEALMLKKFFPAVLKWTPGPSPNTCDCKPCNVRPCRLSSVNWSNEYAVKPTVKSPQGQKEGEAQPHSLWFRRKKGLEDVLYFFRRNDAALVGYLYPHAFGNRYLSAHEKPALQSVCPVGRQQHDTVLRARVGSKSTAACRS